MLDGAYWRRTLQSCLVHPHDSGRALSNARVLPWPGRSGTTFGDPAAAAKGDTSEATQFKKSAGDFSRNDSGGGAPDIGNTVRPPRAASASADEEHEAASPGPFRAGF